MPTYDMHCEHCGERFEIFRMRLLRDEDKVCPACGSLEVKPGVGGGAYLGRVNAESSGGCGVGSFG